jgi:hypothetical protein
MQANRTPATAQRAQSDLARTRAIVRFNTVMFHGLAAASLMESAAPLHAERVGAAFGAQPEARLWLEQAWVPQKSELARRMREYVGATWPEFDWSTSCEEFLRSRRVRDGLARRRPAALEALRLCVWETQGAMFYRALARAADDAALRALAGEAAAAHAAFFAHFRGVYEHCKRRERVGFAATWRTLPAVCRSARELHMRAAFDSLAGNWNGPRTVPELTYGEFVERIVQLVRRHSGVGRVEQLLFRPWLKTERPAPGVAPLAIQPA